MYLCRRDFSELSAVIPPVSSGTYTVNILQQYHDLLYTIIPIVSKDLSAAVENPIYLMESRMHAVELRKVSFISNQSIRDSPCSLLFFVLESLRDNDDDDDDDDGDRIEIVTTRFV